MAIYHLHQSTINRSKGHSAFQALAYQSRDKIVDEYTGEVVNYTKKGESLYSVFELPTNADKETFATPLDLVREMERCENSANATTGVYGDVALPKELSLEQQKELIDAFAKTFTEQGQAVIINMHPPHTEVDGTDNNNYHFHYIATVRQFDENGKHLSVKNKCFKEYDVTDGKERKFLSAEELKKDENKNYKKIFKYKVNGKIEELTQDQAKEKGLHPTKDRTSRNPLYRGVYHDDFMSRENLIERRKAWEVCANEYLAKYGIDEKIDCRTLKEQGIDREPTKHLGPKFHRLAQKGIELANATHNRIVKGIETFKQQSIELFNSITHREPKKEIDPAQAEIDRLNKQLTNLNTQLTNLNTAKTNNKKEWDDAIADSSTLNNKLSDYEKKGFFEKLMLDYNEKSIQAEINKNDKKIDKCFNLDTKYTTQIANKTAQINHIQAVIKELGNSLSKTPNEPKQEQKSKREYIKQLGDKKEMEFNATQKEIYNIAIDLAQAKLESIKPSDQRGHTDNELRNKVNLLTNKFDESINSLPKLEQQQVLNQIKSVYDKLASGTPEEYRTVKALERKVIKPHIENERSLSIDR